MSFEKVKNGNETFIIPPGLFEVTKSFMFIEITYCEPNQIKSKLSLRTFYRLINNSFRMVMVWKTRNIRSLFSLKVKNYYKSRVMYYI